LAVSLVFSPNLSPEAHKDSDSLTAWFLSFVFLVGEVLPDDMFHFGGFFGGILH